MKIEKLDIKAFGSFVGRTISLSDGLNVVYGENEAGKSTLHKFIGGMFFGFFKPYTKNKTYSDDYDRYKPWASERYEGAVEYTYKGKRYRLERNFLKTAESVKLYDMTGGVDVSALMAYDKTSKLPLANVHMDINASVFENTVSIAQAENVTKDILAEEIGDSLTNAASTMTAEISLKKTLERLSAQRALIGTERQSKSAFGIASEKLRLLRREAEEAETAEKVNKLRREEKTRLEEEIAPLKDKEGKLKEREESARLSASLLRYKKYVSIKKEIDGCSRELENLGGDGESAYTEYLSLKAALNEAERGMSEAKEKTKRAQERAASLGKELSVRDRAEDERLYEEARSDKSLLERRMSSLKASGSDAAFEEIFASSDKKNKLARFEKISKIGAVLSFVLACGGFLAGRFADFAANPALQIILYRVTVGFAALVPASLLAWAVCASGRADSGEALSSAEELSLMELTALREKYNKRELSALSEVIDALYVKRKALNEKYALYDNYAQAAKAGEDEAVRQLSRVKSVRERLKALAQKTGAEGEAELAALKNSIGRKKELEGKAEGLKSALTELMRGVSPSELKREAEKASRLGLKAADCEAREVKEQLIEVAEKIREAERRTAVLSGAAEAAEAGMRSSAEIAEDAEYTAEELRLLREKDAALALAYKTIEGISGEIHAENAEGFNSRISDVICGITDGRYDDVKVSDKMNITVNDRRSMRMTDVMSLSAGTVDQMYFALRIAVAQTFVSDASIPLFLDDCFVQYDEERLKNVLTFLSELARERQIILFTCRKDEARGLAQMSARCNLIELKRSGEER